MKYFYQTFLIVLIMDACTSCTREKVIINLENYYWNSKHAIYSRFVVKNDLIYLKEKWTPFTGTIQLNQSGKPALIYDVERGNVVRLEIDKKDEEGSYQGTYEMNDGKAEMNSISEFENVRTVTQWTSSTFSNKDFIEGTIQNRESESLFRIKKDGKSIESKIVIREQNNIRIKELSSINTEGGELLINIASFKKWFKDSTLVEVDFTERGLDNILNESLNDKYSETIKISKGGEALRMKISYTQDKDVILYATVENFNGKMCKDLDFLDTDNPELSELIKKKTDCVSDGLSIYNSITGKSLDGDKIRKRFSKKINSKSLFSKTAEDISFYF